jgi:hypothetical protein
MPTPGGDLLVPDVGRGERVRLAAGKEAKKLGGFSCYKRGAAGVVSTSLPLTTNELEPRPWLKPKIFLPT